MKLIKQNMDIIAITIIKWKFEFARSRKMERKTGTRHSIFV